MAHNDRFLTILASIGDAVIASDTDANVAYMNAVAEVLTGWTLAEAEGKPIIEVFRIVNEYTHEPVENPVDRVLREGRVVGLANHTLLIRRDGTETPIDDSGAPIRDRRGKLLGAVVVFRDISERVALLRRQNFLAEASRLFASSLDYETTLAHICMLAVPQIADWCAIDLFDDTGVLRQVAVNSSNPDALEDMSELRQKYNNLPGSLADIARRGETLLIPTITDAELRAAMQSDADFAVLRRMALNSIIYAPLTVRGEVIGVISFGNSGTRAPLSDYERVLGEELSQRASVAIENARLFRDAQREVERRRAAEAEQRATAHQLRLIADSIPALIAYVDRDYRYQFINKGYEEWFGRPREEVIGRHISELVGDAAFEQTKPRYETVLSGEPVQFEAFMPYANARGRHISGNFVPDFAEDGTVKGFYALIHDISQRKQNELALQVAEAEQRATAQQLRVITDAMPALIAYIDSEHRYQFNNGAYETWFGLSRDEMTGKTMREILGEAAYTAILPHIETALSGQTVEFETRADYRFGGSRYINGKYMPDFDEQGRVRGFFSLVNDISERKQNELALHDANQRLRAIIDGAPVGIAVYDLNGIVQMWSPGAERIFGWKAAEAIGQYIPTVRPEKRDQFQQILASIIQGEQLTDVESVRLHQDGRLIDVVISAAPVRTLDGQVTGLISITHDVTERKRQEQALYDTNQRLRAIIDSSPVGVVAFDLDGIVQMWSPAAEQIFGWTAAEAIGQFMPTIRPEYRDQLQQSMDAMLRGEPVVNLEAQRRRKDGTLIDIIFSSAPLRTPEGQVTGFISLTSDITERKAQEQALRESFERTNQILESISDSFYSLDDDFRFTYINHQAETEWKKERGALLGQRIWEAFPGYNETEAAAFLEKTMRERVAQQFETYSKLLDRYVSVNVYPQANGGVSVYFRDVTARRRIEQTIREGAERLRQLAENMPVMLSVVNEDDVQIVWNAEAERVTGYTLAEMQQPNSFQMLYPDVDIQNYVNHELQFKRRNYRDWVLPTTCKDGTVRYISWSNVTQDVPIPGWADWAVGVDVTERRLLEAERERYYEAEKQARHDAEAALYRIARLQAITAALSQAVTPAQVADICVNNSSEALHADRSGILILSGDGKLLELRASRGLDAPIPQPLDSIPMQAGNPYADCASSGEPVWIATRAEFDQMYPEIAATTTPITGTQTLVALPLKVEGRVIGVIGFSYKAEHSLDQGEREFMLALADQCSQAMERARLYEAEQAARKRFEVLANASTVLSGSLEYETTLQSLGALLVPSLADWCTVHLLDGADNLEQLVLMHKDPAKIAWAQEIQRRYPDERNPEAGLWKVLTTGKPEFYPEITDAMLVAAAKNDEQLALLREIGYAAVIIVPLVSRDQVLGAIQLVSTAESGRHYTEADLALTLEIARRAGIAIDKARLYREVVNQRALAESLRDTALIINGTLDIQEVAAAVLDNMGEVVPHDMADIILIEGDYGRLIGTRGLSKDDLQSIGQQFADLRLPLKNFPIFQQMIATREPYLVADVRAEPTWIVVETQRPQLSYLGVPLSVRGEVIGFLNLNSMTPGFFNAAHVERLQAFAAQAATAISNAQLYSQAQELAAIEERQRLARDLHDAVTQMLFSSSLLAESLSRLRDPKHVDQLWERIEQLARLNRGAHSEMRNLLLELRSDVRRPELNKLLDQLATAAMGRTPNLNITVRIEGKYPLTNTAQSALYRIAQEALNNTIKHARATTVEIVLDARADGGSLIIADNGRGFNPRDAAAGMGVGNMRDRANMIDARLDVDTAPGQGTRITVSWQAAPDVGI